MLNFILMTKPCVLIVEDDPGTAQGLAGAIASWDFQIEAASDRESALEQIEQCRPSAVILNVGLSEVDGFELLRAMRLQYPALPVILLTGNGSVETAVQAIQDEGAFYYFEKPVDFDRLRPVLERASHLHAKSHDGALLTAEQEARGSFGEMVGASANMRAIYALIEQVASSSASVLITGESGTGKELVARTIHHLSPRKNKQFVAINCSAIPETLMESELFGHEKGAFTGAASRRHGCFELADGGTLFLDEIAEMPALLQAKLLRVLEERTVRRLGGSHEIPVDVRVLAATNRDPSDAVRSGHFREDLLYRLNVITIELPPLRLRKDDIPLLAQHLISQLAERHERPARRMSMAAVEALMSYHWPGNVRELRNVVERAVIICSGESIERHHLAPYPLDQRARARSEDTITLPVGTPIEEVERQMILRTLQKTENNKTRAAELLQISLKTLHNKLRYYRERGLMQPSTPVQQVLTRRSNEPR